jgi:hypothetical protein
MNEAISTLVNLARKEVGTREGPVQNTGQRIVEYQGATWLQPGAWPWCAAFTCWLMREWVEEESVRAQLQKYLKHKELTPLQTEKVRCRDASAFGWEKWARSWGVKVLPDTSLARAGDFVIFDFSHIGLVVDDQSRPTSKIKTIEGNTNGKGEREGDGVWEKERAANLTKCYVRIFA